MLGSRAGVALEARARGRDCCRHALALRARTCAAVPALRRQAVRDRQLSRASGARARRRRLGVHDLSREQLAPAHLALAHARRHALRYESRRATRRERAAPRAERGARVRGVGAAHGRDGAQRAGRGAVRAAPAARRVGRVGLGAQGLAVCALCAARARGLAELGARAEPSRVRGGARVHGARSAREADAGVAAALAPGARLLAARAAVELAAGAREAAVRSALGRLVAGHDARAGGRDAARRPVRRATRERVRRLRGHAGADVRAAAARGVVSPSVSGSLVAGGRRARRRVRRRTGRARAGAPAARSLSARWRPLVRARARPDRRSRAGRLPVARGPLRVPATDRCRLGGGVGCTGSPCEVASEARSEAKPREGRVARGRPRAGSREDSLSQAARRSHSRS